MSAGLFNSLLSMPAPNPNPTQQMCHLREFFIVHHLREKEDKRVAEITIPTFQPQRCIVDLNPTADADPRSTTSNLVRYVRLFFGLHWKDLFT